jgi:ribulose-bisphosphate carboxylase large chain
MSPDPRDIWLRRLQVHYRLTVGPGESPEVKAEALALEQTVELPPECLAPGEERMAGRVESLGPEAEERCWRASISYDPDAVGEDLPQLLNLLFGNVSLQRGVLIEAIDWPPALLAAFGGPRFGIPGLRELAGVQGRALLCAAAKPLGASAAELARRCGLLALGGMDLVKDDHGLAGQPSAPFHERVRRCQEAVARANAETGGATLYLPNLTGPAPGLAERAAFARDAGCRAAFVSPLLVGLDGMRALAATSGLALLAHPALAGAFLQPGHGFAPELLLGEIFRIAGADGVIFPNAGGRFPLSESPCLGIAGRLRVPLPGVLPAFPVPAGGVEAEAVPRWIGRYGADTLFLLGSSLYREGDLRRAAERLVESVARTGR